jgi:hypothetical protein
MVPTLTRYAFSRLLFRRPERPWPSVTLAVWMAVDVSGEWGLNRYFTRVNAPPKTHKLTT